MAFLFVLGCFLLGSAYIDLIHSQYNLLGFDLLLSGICFGYVIIVYKYRRNTHAGTRLTQTKRSDRQSKD
jgi:hypothetical protein